MGNIKSIYLVRHLEPDVGHAKFCLGRTLNPHISYQALEEAKKLKNFFSNIKYSRIYTSPLLRCVESGKILGDPIPIDALSEMDTGEWDGRSFEEIKIIYNDLYNKRAEDASLVPKCSETYEKAFE